MPRDFYVNGPAMVFVHGGAHWLLAAEDAGDDEEQQEENNEQTLAFRQQLGLTSEEIRITPSFNSRDILIDSYGSKVPAEVMWNLAEARIDMTLVHYDPDVLADCVQESMAGGLRPVGIGGEAGELAPASMLMGNGLPLLSSGNHFIKLLIDSPRKDLPWIFPAAYLDKQPFIYPLGVGASAVQLTWRALPYQPLIEGPHEHDTRISGVLPTDLRSQGAVLWTHDQFQ